MKLDLINEGLRTKLCCEEVHDYYHFITIKTRLTKWQSSTLKLSPIHDDIYIVIE